MADTARPSMTERMPMCAIRAMVSCSSSLTHFPPRCDERGSVTMSQRLFRAIWLFASIGLGVSALSHAESTPNAPLKPLLNRMELSLPQVEEPVPSETRSHREFPLAGAILLGASYALPFGLAVRFDERLLYIPVFGPLAELSRCRECTGSNVQKLVI